MKKIKVLAKSKSELEIQEKAEKGDLIDLNQIEGIDPSSLIDAINNGRDQAYNQKLLEAKTSWEQENKQLTKIQLEKSKIETENNFQKQIAELEKQLNQVKSQQEIEEAKKTNEINAVKNDYQSQLKLAQEQVELYKDFKAKQSTKGIGESLENYAENEFNKIRSVAYPNAYFEKDNKVSESGSKGDFIFRDNQDGVEFISIMFDMKNEADTTASKHKNSDFFKELDKDRNEKQTEYAVLVSLLEADSELYNQGIVEIHEYPKMYVIRPQFFIPIIGLLRNAALNSLDYKKELQLVKEQNIDVTNFENDLNQFKDSFGKNYDQAGKRFQEAIEAIDKSIKDLEITKDKLLKSENQLRIANNKLDDVSVKKLTKNNPTMEQKFQDLG